MHKIYLVCITKNDLCQAHYTAHLFRQIDRYTGRSGNIFSRGTHKEPDLRGILQEHCKLGGNDKRVLGDGGRPQHKDRSIATTEYVKSNTSVCVVP